MFDVTCLGIMVVDVVARPLRELPDKGKLVLVDRMELHTGGCAVNTGIALASLGCKVAVTGKVGQDGFGDFLIETLGGYGVDTRGVVRDPLANTSATMVMVDPDGERSFVHYLGANAGLTEQEIALDLIGRSRILHIAGSFLMPKFDGQPTANVLKWAREAGLTTSLDTAWDSLGGWLATIEPCLPYIDIFMPSFEEAKMIAGRDEPGDVADFFLGYGIEMVALKMGEKGCFVRTAGEEISLPAHSVEMIDATGAGDCFAAGFLAGVALGWGLGRTTRLANAAGAACITAMGATTGIKSMEETLALVASYDYIFGSGLSGSGGTHDRQGRITEGQG